MKRHGYKYDHEHADYADMRTNQDAVRNAKKHNIEVTYCGTWWNGIPKAYLHCPHCTYTALAWRDIKTCIAYHTTQAHLVAI